MTGVDPETFEAALSKIERLERERRKAENGWLYCQQERDAARADAERISNRLGHAERILADVHRERDAALAERDANACSWSRSGSRSS